MRTYLLFVAGLRHAPARARSGDPILRLLAVYCSVLGLAGCAAFGYSPEELAIRRYYERHASEEQGRCLAPYIDGITRRQVVEETDHRLVLDIRYVYRDRRVDGDENAGTCMGFAARRVVLEKTDGQVRVVEMSSPNGR
jgi:hypothetical protein